MTKLYTPEELSNDDYQSMPQVSGSFLHRLLTHSPAKARFGEVPKRKVLDFGIWAHAMIIENESFSRKYAKGFSADGYESILSTASDMSSWLRDRGLKVSGSKSELIQRIIETGEPVYIEEVERQIYRESFGEEVQLIPSGDFEKIEAMRHSVMADPARKKMIEGGVAELSIVSDEFKCRPDLITSGGWIINYKTTLDAAPDKFGRNATEYGYPMRSVLECELFLAHYGKYPKGYAIIAQEKDPPYLCKTYIIFDSSRTDQTDAWNLGRRQLGHAIKLYRKCRDSDIWPGLGGAEDLVVPEYILKREGIV